VVRERERERERKASFCQAYILARIRVSKVNLLILKMVPALLYIDKLKTENGTRVTAQLHTSQQGAWIHRVNNKKRPAASTVMRITSLLRLMKK
jgi:hypothetical protein